MTESTIQGQIAADRLDDARAYAGVRTRRVLAFLLDYLIVALLVMVFAVLVFLLGLATFGIGWGLYAILVPLVALSYVWTTMGSERQATLGMRAFGLRLERLDGRPVDGLLAVVHSVLFWAGNVIITPLILLAALFLERKRTVHDLLLGTVVVRTDV